MRSLRRILIPGDASACAAAAVDWAVLSVEPLGADIELLYVWNLRDTAWDDGRAMASFGDSPACKAMDERLSYARREHVRIRGRIEFGELVPTILRVTNAEHFDLVVVGMDDRGLGRVFGTDLAHRLARASRCPVVAVHGAMTGAPTLRRESAHVAYVAELLTSRTLGDREEEKMRRHRPYNEAGATSHGRTRHPHHPLADDGRAFLPDPRDGRSGKRADDLAELLGEEFVFSATSGEQASSDARDESFVDEIGGPFVAFGPSGGFPRIPAHGHRPFPTKCR